MKRYLLKLILSVFSISFLALVGCQTVVTDVNAELAALGKEKKDLGIPVIFNENYTELPPDPVEPEKPETETEQVAEADTRENREDANEDKREDEDNETGDEDKDPEDGEEEVTDEEGEETEEEEETEEVEIPEDFDPEFYAATYPDVAAVYGTTPEALYRHYLEYGQAEGRARNAEEYNAMINEVTE